MTAVAAVRRLSWGFGDQALSSLTNFLMGILVARTATSADFGAFSLAFAVYVLILVVSRGLTGEPLVVRHSHTSQVDWHQATAGASGLALAVGLASSVVVLVIGVVLGGALGAAFVALAVVLPGLIVQDVFRFAFVAQGHPRQAFICDLVWAAILLPGLILLHSQGTESLAYPILIWGVSAAISAGVGMALGRILPSLRRVGAWFRESRDLGTRYATEALLSLAPIQVTLFVVGAIAGLAGTAALRGAGLLLGPIQMLLISVTLIGVSEGVRLARSRGVLGIRRPAIALSAGIATITLVWGVFLSLLPEQVGEKLLGETWDDAMTVLLPLTLGYVGVTLGFGAGVGLRVLADARRGLRAHSVDAAAQVTGGVLGAVMGGAVGAAVGFSIGLWIGTIAWWVQFEAAIVARVSSGHDRLDQNDGPPDGPIAETAGGIAYLDPESLPADADGQNGARTHHTIDL